MKKRILAFLIAAALMCSLLPGGFAEEAAYQVGDKHSGFTVTDVRDFALLGADVITLEHDKTGAQVMLLLNEDTNRIFEITFRTVVENNQGTPHVFEHATLSGSEKYPSKALFFNLVYQTYNTYMNAFTDSCMTSYPVASLSEEQLLKLADFYVDSCFHPTIMTEEGVFRREAWRYEMTDADAPLTLNGTVYNEMKGATTLSSTARLNFVRTLLPGSVLGNECGGEPEFIPELTWQALKDYHDTYYHPSNSLTILYGKIENPDAFLGLLDSVFSCYEYQDMSSLFTDSGYEPLTEAVETVYSYPVEEGTDTKNGAEVYYGFRCENAGEELFALDQFADMVNSDGSTFQQLMKQKLPSASAYCLVNYENTPLIAFAASGLNAEDAPLFREIVDTSMAEIAEKGFPMDQVEAVKAYRRLSVLLLPEKGSVVDDILPNLPYFWSSTGNLYGYMEYIESLDSFTENAASGTFQRIAREYIVNNPIHALAVTEPVPGLKEQREAELAQHLAETKAAMSQAEIDAIVASTNQAEEEGADTDAMVAQLTAVAVDTLPEEYRIFDIQETQLEHGIRSFFVPAAGDGVGRTMLRIDISSIPQEQLHWLMLYLELVGSMDTTAHTQAELNTLLLRCSNGLNIGPVFVPDDSEMGFTPYLQMEAYALEENLLPLYELVEELLFSTDLSDTDMLAGLVSNTRIGTKMAVNSNGFVILMRHLFGKGDEGAACKDYMNHLPYYEFLCWAEETAQTNPQVLVEGLEEIRTLLQSLGRGAVFAYVGSEEGCAANAAAAQAFLARMTFEERERAEYSFEPVAASEGWALETDTNYNEVFATWEDLGLEKYTADWDAVSALVTDRYTMPELRELRGAYDAFMGGQQNGLYVYSYRDPGVAESFAVFSRLGDMLRSDTGITQELLDGYILSSYSRYAMPNGELTDGYKALTNMLAGHPQEEKLENMRALKSITVERLPEYADVIDQLMEKGVRGTVSSASGINANAGLYEKIVNPFNVVDASQVELTDVDEAHPYYAAIRTAFEGGCMEAADGAFRPEDSLTLGEFSAALYVCIGGAFDPEEAIAALNANMILPADPADTLLTREDAVVYLNNFLLAMGAEMEDETLGEYADADQISEYAAAEWAWMLANGIVTPREDGLLAPNEAMTRAEFACMLANIM